MTGGQQQRPIQPSEHAPAPTPADGTGRDAAAEPQSMFGELVFPPRTHPVRPALAANGPPILPGGATTQHPLAAGVAGASYESLQHAQSQMMSQWRAQVQPQANGSVPPFALPEKFSPEGHPRRTPSFPSVPSVPSVHQAAVSSASASTDRTAASARPINAVAAAAMPLPTMKRVSQNPVPSSSMLNGANLAKPAVAAATATPAATMPATAFSTSSKTPSALATPSNKADAAPVSAPPSAVNLPIFKTISTIPVYRPDMTEEQFSFSLSKFLFSINLPLKKIPEFQGRPVQMHRLFQVVTTLGGFQKVTESNRWNAVAASLQYWHNNPELLHQLRSFYYTLFYAYEQYFYHRIPLEKIFWPHQAINQAATSAQKHVAATPVPAPLPPGRTGPSPKHDPNATRAPSVTPLKRPETPPLGKTQAGVDQPAATATAAATSASASTSTPADRAKQRKPSESIRDALESVHGLLKNMRSTPATGKVSIEEVTLMLACKVPAVQAAALAMLEQLSWDHAVKLPGPAAMASLIEALVDVFDQQVILQMRTNPVHVKEGTRPFEYLSHREEERAADLAGRVSRGSSVLESIVNILRNWALRPESAVLLAQSASLVWKLLLPSLSKSEVWTQLSLECYKGLWLVLMQVSSLIELRHVAKLEAVMVVALEEIRSCITAQRGHSYRLLSAVTRDIHDTESIKRAIITFIQTSNGFWKRMPSYCFMLIEFLCRVMSNSVTDGVFDLHPTISRNHALTGALLMLLDVLWEVVEVFVVVILFLSSLVTSLMQLESFQKTADYTKWMAMVLHNVNFGLPDGGYLELSLLTILHTLRRLDRNCCSSWCQKVAPELVLQIDRVRKLWMYPSVGPRLEKSPLLTQPINAVTSQPYLVLIRMIAILGHLAGTQSSKSLGLGYSEVARLIDWIAIPAPTAACEELLRSPEIMAITESLLASAALLHNKSP